MTDAQRLVLERMLRKHQSELTHQSSEQVPYDHQLWQWLEGEIDLPTENGDES